MDRSSARPGWLPGGAPQFLHGMPAEGTSLNEPEHGRVGTLAGRGVALGGAIGAACGIAEGCRETRSIARTIRARGEFVDGTGFIPITLGLCVLGTVAGSCLGGIVGALLGLRR